MTIQHHPSDETMAAYAGGTLDTARRLVVASHLERCDICRHFVRGGEEIAAALMDSMAPAEMSAGALARTLARLEGAGDSRTAAAGSQSELGLPAC